MTAVDNTGTVLYHYLRALSVKVSRSTVHRLLDTPVGSSMRGISDALDALHIKNEVYQLPPSADYFTQLEAPFITMLQEDTNPFRVVTKKDDSIVEFGNSERIGVDIFLKRWTGCVLLGSTTSTTTSEAHCRWKNIAYYLSKYKIVAAILLAIILGMASAGRYNSESTFISYVGTLAFGMLVSVAILYKEQINDRFLEQFCHIGKAVDCNEVLHSKGASIAGVGLGELSLLYFATHFLYCVLCPKKFCGIAFLCCTIALCFTLYSVIYQLFIVRKGCMLCMLVNITIWVSAVILYGNIHNSVLRICLTDLSILATTGCVCLIAGISLKSLYKDYKEKVTLQQRMARFLSPEVFQRLLPLEAHIEEPIPANIALQSRRENSRLMIVTNPNCGNCAKMYPQIKELSSTVPISLILLTFPNDRLGEYIAQTVIAAYLSEGWQKAMSLLEEWYRNRRMSEADKYPVTPEAERMWKEQQKYCRKQKIGKTPVSIAMGYYVPEVYSLDELKYVLT